MLDWASADLVIMEKTEEMNAWTVKVKQTPEKVNLEVPPDVDPEGERRVKRVTDKLSECLHLAANEPSLGLYRLQEHIRHAVPDSVERKRQLMNIQQRVQGLGYDADYAVKTLQSLSGMQYFTGVQQQLKKAIDLKRNLNEDRQRLERSQTSGYSSEPSGDQSRNLPLMSSVEFSSSGTSAISDQSLLVSSLSPESSSLPSTVRAEAGKSQGFSVVGQPQSQETPTTSHSASHQTAETIPDLVPKKFS